MRVGDWLAGEHSGVYHSAAAPLMLPTYSGGCKDVTWCWAQAASTTSWASPLLLGVLTTETLREYLKVVMALDYEEKPPYATLRNNLEVLLQGMRVSPYDPLDLQMVP